MIAFYAANMASLLVVFLSGTGHPFPSVLLSISFLVSLSCYTHAIFSSTLSAVSASFFLYYCYGFILSGLMQVRSDQFYWINNGVRREFIPDASVVVLLATLTLAAGYAMAFQLSKKRSLQKPSNLPEINVARVSMATMLCSLIAAFYLMTNILKFGPFVFIGTRYTVSSTIGTIGLELSDIGITLTLTRGLALAAFVVSAFVFFQLKVRNLWTKLALIVSSASLVVANFPPALPRFWLIATVIGVYMSVWRTSFFRHKVALFSSAPLLMFLVFPFLQSYNRRTESLDFGFSFTSPLEGMLHGDYDGFQAIINVFSLLENDGLSWGNRIVSAALFFVPRSIWEGKSSPTGSDAAEAAGFDFLNISSPLPAEFFSDFHYIGLAIGMFIVGGCIRYLDERLENVHNVSISILAILLAGFAPIIARGPLLGVIAAPASAAFLVLIWALLIGAVRRNIVKDDKGVSERLKDG